MSLRLNDNLSTYLISSGVVDGVPGAVYNWPGAISATGTGNMQAIELPESGLDIGNILVFDNGQLKTTGYHISGSYLVMMAELGNAITVVRYGAGSKGDKGDTGEAGQTGQPGVQGQPFIVVGALPSMRDLPEWGVGNQAYIVNNHIYAWQDSQRTDLGVVQMTTSGGYNYDMDGGSY